MTVLTKSFPKQLDNHSSGISAGVFFIQYIRITKKDREDRNEASEAEGMQNRMSSKMVVRMAFIHSSWENYKCDMLGSLRLWNLLQSIKGFA